MRMDGGMPVVVPTRTIRELEAEITSLAGHLNAATYRWLTLLTEFDDRKGWHDCATQSCAHWLNWKCGIDFGAAREKVRVAHALETLPKIAASMATGELSYSKVRAITRVATPATEDVLLMVALHGTAAHVEKLVRGYRRAQEAEALSREAQQQTSRCMSYHWDDDGSLVLKARLPAEAGVLVLKALDVAMENLEPRFVRPEVEWANRAESHTEVSAETPSVKLTPGMARADALAVMAESFLAHGAEAMSGGDKHQVVIHVSAETVQLNSDQSLAPIAQSPGFSEFEDGPAIASETARRLACDSSVVRIIEDGEGNPLDIGRKTRAIPPALRRALNSRDQGCRFPGCCNKRYTHGHHVVHWANGGETKLINLITLCYFHHRLVHEGGWDVQVLDDGAFRFLRPDGEALDASIPANPDSDASRITHYGSRQPSQWRGDKMDYHLATMILFQKEKRGGAFWAERGEC